MAWPIDSVGGVAEHNFGFSSLVLVVSRNFHESFSGGEVKPPSERATGLVFAAVAAIVALLWRNSPTVLWLTLGIATTLAIVSLLAPSLLKPISRLWFQFGLLLHRVVNPIVMFAIFAFIFVPAGAIMRLWHDPLRKRRAPDGTTYWIERDKNVQPKGSMTNQF